MAGSLHKKLVKVHKHSKPESGRDDQPSCCLCCSSERQQFEPVQESFLLQYERLHPCRQHALAKYGRQSRPVRRLLSIRLWRIRREGKPWIRTLLHALTDLVFRSGSRMIAARDHSLPSSTTSLRSSSEPSWNRTQPPTSRTSSSRLATSTCLAWT